MSRVTVRQAVANFFAAPAVPGLNRVYSAMPKRAPASDVFIGTGTGTRSGAWAFPFIEAQHEQRYALTGAPNTTNDGKRVVYEVAFKVLFLSDQAKGTDAMDDHDTIIDGICQRLRMDRTLGGAVFQIGEGDTIYGDDIRVISGFPKQILKSGRLEVMSMCRFVAVEMI